MNPIKRVTLRDIAREAGLTAAAVSMALKNHPRISKATITRVRQIADRLGYIENPLLSRLMTELQQQKKRPYSETIALLTAYEDSTVKREPYLRELFWGIHDRSRELGYGVEEFNALSLKVSGARLAEILIARGVRGVIVAPFRGGRRHISLDFTKFAAVAAGVRTHRPPIDCAVTDHFYNLYKLAQRLYRAGYRRMAFATERERLARNEFRWLGGYLTALANMSHRQKPMVFQPSAPDAAAFHKWLKREKPDAIISSIPAALVWLRGAGLSVPEDMGYLATSCGLGIYPSAVSGTDERPCEVGRTAVDLLASQLARNEHGLPMLAHATLVKGNWVDGGTIR